MNYLANMEDSPRLIWLLLLVLFQPTFTGAACLDTRSTERKHGDYYDDYGYDFKYYIQCTLTSLQMNVPLTTYISEYANEATEPLTIEFTSSTINTVPVGVFQALSGLIRLKMDHASINNIEPGALHGLIQLEELNLDHNNISEIQDGTFDDLGQLETLRMMGNKLTTLKSLKGLASLTWLDLDRNNIETIEDDAFKETVNLKILDLSRNKLVDLHVDTFEELHSLTTLSIGNNRITSIPVGTFRHLGNLTVLRISDNFLTHLEYGLFSGLTSLDVLDVSNNNIAMLDSKVLFPLTSLTRLNLAGNLLRTFDVDTMVSHLTTLGSIRLDHNQIRCELLTSYIYIFRSRNIKVDTGHSFTTKNVHGIYCVSDNATTHTQTMEDHNDHTTVGYNIAEVFRAENEKTNGILKNIHFLLVFATVAVIFLIILNLLINLYFTKRNNIDNCRNSSSSCAVELLNVTD